MSNSNETKTLNEIFENKIFRIPDFQRGYSWGEDELEDLWEDINRIQPEKTHYTGMITVLKKELSEENKWLQGEGYSEYQLIDGQQRITSIIILLNELLSQKDLKYSSKPTDVLRGKYLQISDDENSSFIFGYEKDDPSNEHFKTKILGHHSFQASNEKVSLYTQNLDGAKSFFKEKLKDKSNTEKIEIFRKVTQRLKFNYYEIESEEDVYITFETMNNRGKKLSNLELLKNRLIYLSTIIQQTNNLRKGINDVWKTIYAEFGDKNITKYNEDDFLKEHWIMYFTYDRSISEPAKNYLLKELFTANKALKNCLTAKDIEEYIGSLQESVKQWAKIVKAEHENEEIKIWFEKLHRLKWGAFRPLTMAILQKETDENKILTYLKVCERFNFLVFEVADRNSNTKNSVFYKLAREYYQDEKTLDNVILTIENCITDSFDIERFCNLIAENYKKESGFYSWGGLKYFLYEYELYLQKETKSKKTLLSYEEYSTKNSSDVTIEHIFPQTSSNIPYWQERFNDEDSNIYLNSLGNLLLLSRNKNSELSNNSFDEKKKSKQSYTTGSQSEIEVACYEEWTKETIIDRGKRMLGFMKTNWKIEISEEQIEKLLTNKNK